MKYKKILKIDSRQKHFHSEFGSTTAIEAESHFGDGMPLLVEQPDEVSCTEYSLVKVAYSQTKNNYDVASAWAETPHGLQGASPQDTIGSAVKNGLLNLATKLWDFVFGGYFQADSGPLSRFENVQSSMTLAKSSAHLNSYWYANWVTLQSNEVMPQGDKIISEHSYVFVDWEIVNGVTMAKIDAHQGFYNYMPPEVFNAEFSKKECMALMPTTKQVLIVKARNLFTWVLDLCANIILNIQRTLNQITTQPMPTPQPVPVPPPVATPTPEFSDKIINWAKGIAQWEGDVTGVNPGNMKFTTLTKSWGATQGRPALDGGNFALFKDYQNGFNALCNFLKMACEGELIISHPSPCTFQQFTVKYAGNPPMNYINGVASMVPCKLTDDISTFL